MTECVSDKKPHTHTHCTHIHTHTHTGTVGISVRYHDISIACITAHFAADKHGKSGFLKRNKDSARMLTELSLTYDTEEFDVCIHAHTYTHRETKTPPRRNVYVYVRV